MKNPAWVPCRNFSRGSKAPQLQAVSCRVNLADQTLGLSHPKLQDLTIDPNNAADNGIFIQWITQISPQDRALPARLVRAPNRGMTDTNYPSISLINRATHAGVVHQLGQEISHLRWRGNLIMDELDPWAEMGWVGKRITVGEAELEIREPIVRCNATTASTRTGQRDADTLGALKSGFGHQFMGVYAVVVKSGAIGQGDTIELV